MTSTPRTASTSDARKRQAEAREHGGQLGTFVDPDEPAEKAAGTERATELLDRITGRLKEATDGSVPDEVASALDVIREHLTPPSSVISTTDDAKPTLAKVTFEYADGIGQEATHVPVPRELVERVNTWGELEQEEIIDLLNDLAALATGADQ